MRGFGLKLFRCCVKALDVWSGLHNKELKELEVCLVGVHVDKESMQMLWVWLIVDWEIVDCEDHALNVSDADERGWRIALTGETIGVIQQWYRLYELIL